MSKIRKQYNLVFRGDGCRIEQCRSGLSVVAKELEISPSLLYRWRREPVTKAGTGFPGKGQSALKYPGQGLPG